MQTFLVDTGSEYVETSLIQPNDEWVITPAAANILAMTVCTMNSLLRPTNNYMEIRRKVRGTRGKQSPRGQGHLWYAPDLLLVMKIARAVGCTRSNAFRIFRAHKFGRITIQVGDLI